MASANQIPGRDALRSAFTARDQSGDSLAAGHLDLGKQPDGDRRHHCRPACILQRLARQLCGCGRAVGPDGVVHGVGVRDYALGHATSTSIGPSVAK